MSEDVLALTRSYETWLGEQVPVLADGLAAKHRALAGAELAFLRGTYYLWLVRVGDLLPDVLARTGVPLVGDLHVENFGTWRDAGQVRRWGVNDLDELARGPWLLDLLRLATSAVVAPHIRLDDAEVCRELLATYAAATPRAATDLAEPGAEHLADLVPAFRDPASFYDRLAHGAAAEVPDQVARAAAAVAEPGWRPTWHAHEAGTGSLGHRRAVGVGPAADGSLHAREAKELGPGTAVWAAGRVPHAPVPDPGLYAAVERAVRGPAGATRVAGWQVRDLAPDVVRIELSGLHHHDGRHLLRAMAQAVADVHGAGPDGGGAAAAARAEAADLAADDLAAMVATMARSTHEDHARWRRRH